MDLLIKKIIQYSKKNSLFLAEQLVCVIGSPQSMLLVHGFSLSLTSESAFAKDPFLANASDSFHSAGVMGADETTLCLW